MNTDEFHEELKQAHGIMNRISTALNSNEGISNNPTYSDLRDRMEFFYITTSHVLDQLRDRSKEQKYSTRPR